MKKTNIWKGHFWNMPKETIPPRTAHTPTQKILKWQDVHSWHILDQTVELFLKGLINYFKAAFPYYYDIKYVCLIHIYHKYIVGCWGLVQLGGLVWGSSLYKPQACYSFMFTSNFPSIENKEHLFDSVIAFILLSLCFNARL